MYLEQLFLGTAKFGEHKKLGGHCPCGHGPEISLSV